MLPLSRRDTLRFGLAGGALLWLGCAGDPESTATGSCALDDAGPEPTLGAEPAGVEAIAAWVETVSEVGLVEELRAGLASGWTSDAVFAGLLLAGARRIDSRLGGGGFHFVLQVAALRDAAQLAPADEQIVPLVFGLLGTVRSIAAFPWWLPEVGPGELPPIEGASARLVDATERGAVEEAMREVLALARGGSVRALHDTLLEIGCRRGHQLGHEAICAGKVVPLLAALPGAWAEDVLRAVTFMFASQDKDPPGRPDRSDLWSESRAQVVEVPCTWRTGVDDPVAVDGLIAELRQLLEPDRVVERVARALGEGLSVRSLWDALVLASGDSAFVGANYHAFTSVQALRDAYEHATSERVRLLLLLRGAAFVGYQAFAPSSHDMASLSATGATLDDVFARSGAPSVEDAVGHLAGGGDQAAFTARLLEMVRMRATEEHHYKVAHAALVEAERVPEVFRPRVLALSRLYGPTNGTYLCDAWELTR